MAAGSTSTGKNAHLEEKDGRAEGTVDICVFRRSVSLAATGWTAAVVVGRRRERESSR